MRKLHFIFLLFISNFAFTQQSPTGTSQLNFSYNDWFRGGNGGNNLSPNIFGTIWNSPIYTVTDSTQRMVLMGSNPTNGISGALGLGTNLTNPQAFLHVANNFSGPFTGNGRLFRTDGLSTVSNSWSMWLTNNAGASVEQFRVSNQLFGNGRYRLGTVSNKGLNFTTNDSVRVTILQAQTFAYDRAGFVGFNNLNPQFHLDIRTQNPNDGNMRGELIFRGRITDDDSAYVAFVNGATSGPIFTPTLLGKQSDNITPALSTIGSIRNGQDLATNNLPATRFISARDYDPIQTNITPDLTMDRVNVINERPIFGWNNAVDQLMTMEANGHLGIGTTEPGNV